MTSVRRTSSMNTKPTQDVRKKQRKSRKTPGKIPCDQAYFWFFKVDDGEDVQIGFPSKLAFRDRQQPRLPLTSTRKFSDVPKHFLSGSKVIAAFVRAAQNAWLTTALRTLCRWDALGSSSSRPSRTSHLQPQRVQHYRQPRFDQFCQRILVNDHDG